MSGGLDRDQGAGGAFAYRLIARNVACTMEDQVTRLMMVLFSMISTTLMGVGVVVALTMGHYSLTHILIGAGIGFVLAIPASWVIARQIAGE